MDDLREEPVCAACGKAAPVDALVEVDDELHQCEPCHESLLADWLVEDRAPRADDTPTRPLGDPDEAAHRGRDVA